MKNLLIILSLAFLLSGCGRSMEVEKNNPGNRSHTSLATEKEVSTDAVIEYGNGVYYFPFRGAKFGNALSAFIKSRTDLEFVSMAGDVARLKGDYEIDSLTLGNERHFGATVGYFAYFKKKPE